MYVIVHRILLAVDLVEVIYYHFHSAKFTLKYFSSDGITDFTVFLRSMST